MSANVSRTLSHLDLPRVINHAKGTPARRSKAATIKAMMKELETATNAKFVNAGSLRTFCTVPAFRRIPIIGGIRIIAKKRMIAER
jgi:hypothetical protein